MEKRLLLSGLYDFYGSLLTISQRNTFELYHLNDMSLAEVGEETGTSRQAVFDLLKRTENHLTYYEEKLGLHTKFHTKFKKAVLDLHENGKISEADMNLLIKIYTEVPHGV